MKIRIWNREKQAEEVENVYGDRLIQLLYETQWGQRGTDSVLSKAIFSKIYGIYQNSPLSRKKISKFIRDFEIPMEDYEPGPYESFNEFFIRRFKPGRRPFVKEPHLMPAFAEGRYSGFAKVTENQYFPVKGSFLTADALVEDAENARHFTGGPMLIARLCPTDYHRFHYPDDGKTLKSYPVAGALHSVNPLALKFKGDILVTNERRVTLLQTKNFGRLAYVEVGALCVGKIVQSYPTDQPFQRGNEKGYFLFGGSTVILMGEPGAWVPDDDILENTDRGMEVLVRLGEQTAHKS